MPRRVEEWIGRTADSKVPERVVERLWKASEERCKCGQSLIGQRWEVDHIIALSIWTGEGHGNRESNLQILGVKCCHLAKTRQDVALKNQASRKLRFRTGIKRARSPMPCGRNSKWKRKLNGQVVLREDEKR